MNAAQLLMKRLDFSSSDLSSGGLLSPTLAKQFVLYVFDATPIFKAATRIPMPAPEHRIPNLGFFSQILGASPGDNTEISSGNRSKPTAAEVQLNAKEYDGEVWIPYNVLEDNTEGPQFQSTVLNLMAGKIGVELSDAALNGDTTTTVTDLRTGMLAVQDGWLKKAASGHVYDAGGANIDEDLFADIYDQMPAKWLDADPNAGMNYKFMLQRGIALDWKRTFARRVGVAADSTLLGAQVPGFFGHDVMKDVNIATTTSNGVTLSKGMFTDPRNLIVGMHTDIEMRAMDWPPARVIRLFVRVRPAFDTYIKDNIVLVENLAKIAA